MRYLKVVMLLVMATLVFPCSAAPVLTNGGDAFYLGRFSDFLRDDSRLLVIDDLVKEGPYAWTALNADSLTPGFSRAAWWLRV